MPTDRSTKVWQNKKGELFHDECFEKDESREGFLPFDMNDLADDDACESCGGLILAGPADDDDEDDQDESR